MASNNGKQIIARDFDMFLIIVFFISPHNIIFMTLLKITYLADSRKLLYRAIGSSLCVVSLGSVLGPSLFTSMVYCVKYPKLLADDVIHLQILRKIYKKIWLNYHKGSRLISI